MPTQDLVPHPCGEQGHRPPEPLPLLQHRSGGGKLEDICMAPPSVAWWGQPRSSGGDGGCQARREPWHLGPSGPGRERAHQGCLGDRAWVGEAPQQLGPRVRAGPCRSRVTGWAGQGGQTAVTWKTQQMGRGGRLPRLCGTALGSTWPMEGPEKTGQREGAGVGGGPGLPRAALPLAGSV